MEPAASAGEEAAELSVHFIDVGQGDSTLVLCGGEAMLIDAGNNDMGTTVQYYLEKQNINSLKYVIGTHPDADHIGGLDVILYKFDCRTVIMPDKESDTATYRDVADTMKEKGYKNTLPCVGDTYSLGSACFTIVGPSREYTESNDCSVAIILRHGDNSFLFTGDAGTEAEGDIIASGFLTDVDIYKAGHHGSSTSSTAELLDAAAPEYAVISCGEGNSYGHPHPQTLDRFRERGIRVFRTDEQGTITVTSDGTGLTWSCSPTDARKPGENAEGTMASGIEPTLEPILPVTYILNTNTNKFHYPDCPSVTQIKDKNRREGAESREEIISQGYEPCKNCNP